MFQDVDFLSQAQPDNSAVLSLSYPTANKEGHIPVLHTFDRLRLLDSVHVVILGVHGTKVVIVSLSSDLEHTAKLPTAEVFVEYVKFPLEPSWTFITRNRRLGVSDARPLLQWTWSDWSSS